MIYSETLKKIYNLKRFGVKLGLDKIRELLRLLNNPQKGLRFIHIGGTNGKGSVSTMVASILQEDGHKVGLFTSPHLHRFAERIKINNKEISKKEIIKLARQTMSIPRATFFEVATAMALKYFTEQKVDFVVLEVGLGGRLDATNAIDKSLVSVITNVELEHTRILGKTLSAIAKEKAGIIKKNSIVVTAETKKEVIKVFKKKCRGLNAKLIFVDKQELLDDYRALNAATALTVIKALGRYNIFIPKIIIKKGLLKAKWPGRFEILQKNPLTIADCAHNPAGMKALAKILKNMNYNRLFLVIGVSQDKNIKDMVRNIFSLVDKFIITKANYRGMDIGKIKDEIIKTKRPFVVRSNVKNAVKKALILAKEKDVICIAGSIYVVDEARRLWKKVIIDPEQA